MEEDWSDIMEADRLWREPTEEEEEHCEKTIKRIGIAILIAVAVGLVAFKCFGVTLTVYEPAKFVLGPVHGQGDYAYTGATLMNDGNVCFAPYYADYVGIYNPVSNTFIQGPVHGQGDYAYTGAALMNDGNVCFAPYYAEYVGIYNPTSNTFIQGPTHGQVNGAYIGAALMNDGNVCFSPYITGYVGIYNPTSNTFILGPAHGQGDRAYNGATLMNDGNVCFSPRNANYVGIYNPTSNTFILGPAHGRGDIAYAGAALMNDGNVCFAPRNADYVGIYNPVSNTFILGPAHGRGDLAYSGATLMNDGNVCFAPRNADYVGIYNPTLNTFVQGPAHGQVNSAYNGATLMNDGNVCFSPLYADYVGIYQKKGDSKPITVFDSQPSIVLDQSGNGNTGTVHSGVSQTKSGMSFDGTINGYINTTFNPHTVLKDQSFSFSIWTIGYGSDASGAIGILDMYFRYLGTTGTKIKPYIRLGIVYDYIGGACIESSEWQHVVWTYDSNAVLSTIYVNGDRKGTKDMTGLGSGWGDAPLTIGRRQSGNAIFNMTGSLDNPAMYNKVLTITDATNLYLAGRNAPVDAISTNGLVLFYDFDYSAKPVSLFDSQPDYVYDLSGNSNTGTCFGGVTQTSTAMSFDGVDDYIDTGLYPADNWQMKINMICNDLSQKFINGAHDNNNHRMYIGTTTGKGNIQIGYGSESEQTITTNSLPYKTEYYLSNGYLYIDNVLSETVGAYNFTGVSTKSIFLGAFNYTSIINYGKITIYDYKVYTNNVLVQWFDFTNPTKRPVGL